MSDDGGVTEEQHRDVKGHLVTAEGWDVGIAKAVWLLRAHGVETCQSCEGGQGHAYLEPTVELGGDSGAGFRALGICLDHSLPVSELSRVWDVRDGYDVHGPLFRLTFTRRLEPPAAEWKETVLWNLKRRGDAAAVALGIAGAVQ